MDINKKRKLEAKLQNLFAQSYQEQNKKAPSKNTTGSVIRRRKGFPDKRIQDM